MYRCRVSPETDKVSPETGKDPQEKQDIIHGTPHCAATIGRGDGLATKAQADRITVIEADDGPVTRQPGLASRPVGVLLTPRRTFGDVVRQAKWLGALRPSSR
jgi:hypothetical protein